MIGDCNKTTWALEKVVAFRLLSSVVIVAEMAFIVHGETSAANALAELIDDACDDRPVIPQYGESFEL